MQRVGQHNHSDNWATYPLSIEVDPNPTPPRDLHLYANLPGQFSPIGTQVNLTYQFITSEVSIEK